MPTQTPVTQELDARAIPYRTFRHPGPVHSLEQAAAERGQQPQQIVRSILFRVGASGAAGKGYVLVLVAGPAQIDWPALRRALGVNRLRMARQEEVGQVTGYEIGAVSPFGLPAPVPVLVDRSVLAQAELSIGSGQRGLAIILASADLLRALGDVPVADLRPTPTD